MTWLDVVRVVVLLLWAGCLGESLWTFRRYRKVIKRTRRLLPWHVTTVSLATLGTQSLVTWVVVDKSGDPPHWFSALALLFLGLGYASLILIRLHVERKADTHVQIVSLLREPDVTP